MLRMLVAGCVGAAAVACAYYWFTADDKEEEQLQLEEQNPTVVTRRKTEFPDLPDLAAIMAFYHENLRLEECLKSGRIDEGIEHLSNSVEIHTSPTNLLKMYER